MLREKENGRYNFYKMSFLTFKQFHSYGGLLGFLLYFRSILMIFLLRGRDIEEVATVDTSAFVQIIYATICFFAAASSLVSSSTVRSIQFKTPLRLLAAFHILGLISITWSVSPTFTGYRAFECIAYSLLILTALHKVYQKGGPEVLLQWVLFYAALAIIASVVARAKLIGLNIFSLQTFLREQMNSTPFFFFALLLSTSLSIKALILSISIFSLSNTAYAGMGLGLMSFSSGSKWLKILFFLILSAVAIIISTYGINAFLQNTIFYGKEGVGIEHTTGRDAVFQYAWEQAQKRPLSGYGFVAGDTFVINQKYKAAISAHNGFLSALLGMGYPGALIFSTFLVAMLSISRSRFLPGLYRSAFLGSSILITIHTIGNPGLGTRVYGTWMPSVVVLTTICIIYWHFKSLNKKVQMRR